VYAPAWKWGGPPRSSANLAEGTAAEGHEVTVFTTNAGLEDDPQIPTNSPVLRNGVKVFYFSATSNFLGLQSAELERTVWDRVKEFDVVHITGVWQPTLVAGCRACAASGIPYVISPRGALSEYSFSQKSWKKWPYWWLHERRNCDQSAVIHYTASMEKTESERLKLRPRAIVIPNSIDLSSWYREEEAGLAWRKTLSSRGVKRSTCVLLYAGRKHHKKGLDLLPDVLAGLSDTDWHLVLVGDDEDGSGLALEKMFCIRGFRNKVTSLPGTDTSGLRSAYSGSDIFLLPSRHENFGNVAVEAAACGCAVIVSNMVGASDQISSLGGVIVAPRIAQEWTSAISRLREKSVRPERESIVAGCSIQSVAKKMIQLYQEIL
jgi:glycosyltransferase involved in cell wall biosynthesis